MESQMCSGKKYYLGDFNVLIDQQNSVDNTFGLKSQVNKATHNLGHSLYLVIDCRECK